MIFSETASLFGDHAISGVSLRNPRLEQFLQRGRDQRERLTRRILGR